MMDVWPSISLERASSISRARVLAAYLFPLPPLAEQHRIVAKVDELMAVFDRIVASLASGNDTRRHLLNALLHEALSLSEEKNMEGYLHDRSKNRRTNHPDRPKC